MKHVNNLIDTRFVNTTPHSMRKLYTNGAYGAHGAHGRRLSLEDQLIGISVEVRLSDDVLRENMDNVWIQRAMKHFKQPLE